MCVVRLIRMNVNSRKHRKCTQGMPLGAAGDGVGFAITKAHGRRHNRADFEFAGWSRHSPRRSKMPQNSDHCWRRAVNRKPMNSKREEFGAQTAFEVWTSWLTTVVFWLPGMFYSSRPERYGKVNRPAPCLQAPLSGKRSSSGCFPRRARSANTTAMWRRERRRSSPPTLPPFRYLS